MLIWLPTNGHGTRQFRGTFLKGQQTHLTQGLSTFRQCDGIAMITDNGPTGEDGKK